MGPYSRVDFWDRGAAGDLEVPYWARDRSEEGLDRTLDLPCFGEKLKKDYIPPFTCGSDTRRAIIKHFVRDYINKGRQGNSLTEQLVREQIEKLIVVWNDTSKYACQCLDGSGRHDLECCKSFAETAASTSTTVPVSCPCLDGESRAPECCDNTFFPSSLDVLFDEIPAEDVVSKIIQQIDPYLKNIFTESGMYRNPSLSHLFGGGG